MLGPLNLHLYLYTRLLNEPQQMKAIFLQCGATLWQGKPSQNQERSSLHTEWSVWRPSSPHFPREDTWIFRHCAVLIILLPLSVPSVTSFPPLISQKQASHKALQFVCSPSKLPCLIQPLHQPSEGYWALGTNYSCAGQECRKCKVYVDFTDLQKLMSKSSLITFVLIKC